jgi:pullulanase/glycogen debranching enzyme
MQWGCFATQREQAPSPQVLAAWLSRIEQEFHMAKKPKAATFIKDPLWYKDAVIYQVHVKSFSTPTTTGSATFPA